MKITRIIYIIIIFTFVTSFNFAFAQKKVIWNVNLGGSFPLGDFGKMSYDKSSLLSDCGLFDSDVKGGASTGFNVGADLLIPMVSDRINFTLGLDIHYNGLTRDAQLYMSDVCNYVRDSRQQQLESGGATVLSSSCSLDNKPFYLNIPLLAGFRYWLPISREMFLYADGGVGMNLRFINSLKLTARDNYIFADNSEETYIQSKVTSSYDMKGTLAFRFGLGVKFLNNISLSSYFYYLGRGDVILKSNTEHSSEYGQQIVQTKNVILKTITPILLGVKLGYNF